MKKEKNAENIVIIGAGQRATLLLEILSKLKIEIVGIVDSSPEKINKDKYGYRIGNISDLGEYKGCSWCVTVGNRDSRDELRNLAIKRYGLKQDREIHFLNLILDAYEYNNNVVECITKIPQVKNTDRRVFFDCRHGLILGGIERWSMSLCNELIEAEVNAAILSPNIRDDTKRFPYEHQVFYEISEDKQYMPDNIIAIIMTIIPYLPVDIITADTDDVMLAAYLIKRTYPNYVRIISVVHGSNEVFYYRYKQWIEIPDLFVAVSDRIYRDIKEMGVSDDKLLKMNHPFECPKELNRSYHTDDKSTINIGYAGRLDGFENSQKRIDLILKLAKLIYKEGINCIINVAGDGNAMKGVLEFIRENGLEGRIVLIGELPREIIGEFWIKQDICLNLSDYEGYGISRVEAMGYGAVPVVTDTAGARDEIIDGDNGYVVPLRDYKMAFEKIRYLTEHREMLPIMGKKAHDAVYPKSHMSDHVKFWKNILMNV